MVCGEGLTERLCMTEHTDKTEVIAYTALDSNTGTGVTGHKKGRRRKHISQNPHDMTSRENTAQEQQELLIRYKLCLINANGSVLNRVPEIEVLLGHGHFDIVGVTETGLIEGQKPPVIKNFTWIGVGKSEWDNKGGGVGWLVRSDINCYTFDDIEGDKLHTWCGVEGPNDKWALGITYWRQQGVKGSKDMNEDVRRQLEKEIGILRHRGHRVLLAGDFNAHTAEVDNGWQGLDCNGHLLQELCMEMDLSVLNFGPNTKGTWTWERNDLHSRIDYVLWDKNKDGEAMMADMKVDEAGNFDVNSDHNVILWNWRERGTGSRDDIKQRTTQPKRWNITEDTDWTSYIEKLEENIREWEKRFCIRESDASASNIDIMYNEWVEAVHNAARDQ